MALKQKDAHSTMTSEVKSLSRIQLCDPIDCSPPGPWVHGIFPGMNTGVGCHFKDSQKCHILS